jgi:hypothetical protein
MAQARAFSCGREPDRWCTRDHEAPSVGVNSLPGVAPLGAMSYLTITDFE